MSSTLSPTPRRPAGPLSLTAPRPATPPALSGNVSANLLGLGNAATPLGIRAATRMARGSGGQATDELCRLVVLNTASVQLLPTTVAGVRAALGAESTQLPRRPRALHGRSAHRADGPVHQPEHHRRRHHSRPDPRHRHRRHAPLPDGQPGPSLYYIAAKNENMKKFPCIFCQNLLKKDVQVW